MIEKILGEKSEERKDEERIPLSESGLTLEPGHLVEIKWQGFMIYEGIINGKMAFVKKNDINDKSIISIRIDKKDVYLENHLFYFDTTSIEYANYLGFELLYEITNKILKRAEKTGVRWT